MKGHTMPKKTKAVNKYVTIQAIAKGIESKAAQWHEDGRELFQALHDEVKTLTAAGAQGVDIVGSLEAYPVCKSTVRTWINDAKSAEDKNPAQKGQASKANKGKGAGKEAGAKAKADGLPRAQVIVNTVVATIAKAIGEQITDESTLADALKIAKATCNALGRPANKVLAEELASVLMDGELPEQKPTEAELAAIDAAEADAVDAVDVRDAVPA
jgi:hypothetical protein